MRQCGYVHVGQKSNMFNDIGTVGASLDSGGITTTTIATAASYRYPYYRRQWTKDEVVYIVAFADNCIPDDIFWSVTLSETWLSKQEFQACKLFENVSA